MSEAHQVHKRIGSTEPNFAENQINNPRAGFEVENDGLLPITHQELKDSSLKPKTTKNGSRSLNKIDRPAFIVLVILYLLQGIPVGLAFGSIPFILKSKLSYSQVGIFSLAAYPYSLKLLWSPIVDALYSPTIGRRRSWIIPIQTISGITLIYLGLKIDYLVLDPETHLKTITMCFFLLVFFCATQDIAVDGWALTCLSPECLSYASTAQTIGINTGYFSSFTIFLALSSPDFANKYLRTVPINEGLFSLGLYLNFWGWMYLIVTGALFLIPEDPPHLAKLNMAKLSNEKAKAESIYNKNSKVSSNWASLKHVYNSMYQVLKLPNVQTFVVILLIAKFGFQASESATNLKLLEKGLSKEDLSITVLIDFPFEMVFGYYAGRWSNGKTPLKPWLFGFAGRLFGAFLAQMIVYFFPENGQVSSRYFILIILQHLISSFMSTIQFVSLCAFHTKIADPAIGGTYMTTLNTLSNYGGTWPKLIVLYLIDKLTIAKCQPTTQVSTAIAENLDFYITSETLKETCKNGGGKVVLLRDGFYYTNFFCIVCGIFILFWVKKKVTYLQSLPNSAWRVNKVL